MATGEWKRTGRRPAARDALFLATDTAKMKADEIFKDDYAKWRYHYPELDSSSQWCKIP